MASKRKPSSSGGPGSLQGGDANAAENRGTASALDNPDSRSMQAGKRRAGKSEAGISDSDSVRDPDRDPVGSIEAIDESDAEGRVSGADEAELRGNDDPTRARRAGVRDNPRGSPDKPGRRY